MTDRREEAIVAAAADLAKECGFVYVFADGKLVRVMRETTAARKEGLDER